MSLTFQIVCCCPKGEVERNFRDQILHSEKKCRSSVSTKHSIDRLHRLTVLTSLLIGLGHCCSDRLTTIAVSLAENTIREINNQPPHRQLLLDCLSPNLHRNPEQD
ncbi:hypothetical protein HAX54_038703 [Datura stramonium]|uniref:Uncharacterized protein n=1 Tax=Datura stramonium TaxID=4076 RepID=A0ABS8RNF2_DATST|nr:hypothetical protein [Datura stramonium]